MFCCRMGLLRSLSPLSLEAKNSFFLLTDVPHIFIVNIENEKILVLFSCFLLFLFFVQLVSFLILQTFDL
jgi:hypothetical protein